MNTLYRVKEHLTNAMQFTFEHNVVGIFLYGSQNYGFNTLESDVDTRLLVTPSLFDITFNNQPVSNTKIFGKQEHTEFKDIRLFFRELRKQNPNSLEILFTQYKINNSLYKDEWKELIKHREEIARYNPVAAVYSMSGMAYHNFIRDSGNNNCKLLQTLLRMEDFITRYIEGELYENCLKPRNIDFLRSVKRNELSREEYISKKETAMRNIKILSDSFCNNHKNEVNKLTEDLLSTIQSDIIKKSLKMEAL